MFDFSQDPTLAGADATAAAEDAVDLAAVSADTALENVALAPTEPPSELETRDWREELAAKMEEYRARRKPRAPKYPSLQLPLELPLERSEAFWLAPAEPVSLSSLAMQPVMIESVESRDVASEAVPSALADERPIRAQAAPLTTNLIEFPRSFDAPVLWDELAEPLREQPRILEAPEIVPPQPALGGILLEEPELPKPAVASDVPLRPASIARRVFAMIVDGIFVGAAAALGGWIFWKVAREIPPRPQLLVSSAVALAVLWLSYQFLLLVWSGATLGLRACGIELVSLDGGVPGRKQRRWRLLASILSAASLMLGYAWALLDENQLCWHDRITRTYLRVRE